MQWCILHYLQHILSFLPLHNTIIPNYSYLFFHNHTIVPYVSTTMFASIIKNNNTEKCHDFNSFQMGLQSYCKPVVVNIENPVSTQILYLVSLLIVVIFFLLLLRWFDFISVFRWTCHGRWHSTIILYKYILLLYNIRYIYICLLCFTVLYRYIVCYFMHILYYLHIYTI